MKLTKIGCYRVVDDLFQVEALEPLGFSGGTKLRHNETLPILFIQVHMGQARRTSVRMDI